jgi:glutathione S-transferase
VADLRVLRTPHSTNVERIALAAAFKGLTVEWVDVDPDDRGPVRALSGQDLVPVAVDPADGTVVVDSPRILAWMEERWPEPPLWPADAAGAALADVFCRRFNETWKGPPNRLAAALGPVGFDVDALGPADTAAVADDTRRLRAWLDVFEGRLEAADHLGGPAFGVCDVTAWPFLRYGLTAPAADDADPFHRVLHERGGFTAESHPRLADWVVRVGARPTAA